jgi:serine/alanine adding enzyme
MTKYTVVSDFDSVDKQQWLSFVASHPDGNIFQTPKMYSVYERSEKYEPLLLVVQDKDEIKGVLLAEILKTYSGVLGHFTSRSIIFGGPLLKDNNPDLLREIISRYLVMVKNKAIYTQIRNFTIPGEGEKQILKELGFKFEDHLNILLNVEGGSEILWKNIKRNRKDGINKAKKQGFVFSVTDHLSDVEIFFKLYKNLYLNNKVPFSNISLFDSYNEILQENQKWFVLDHNNEPVIVLCAFQFNRVLYAFDVGISQDPEFQKLRPVDFFYWEVIRWCSENGYAIFDWMGAGKPDEEYGVRKFKLQYGGEATNQGRFLKIHNPALYHFGKFALPLWKKISFLYGKA